MPSNPPSSEHHATLPTSSLTPSSGSKHLFQPLPQPPYKLPINPPVVANFDSTHLVIGAGVAIFHLATARVVVCRHSVKNYWFLPKGRRDAGEETGAGAEREGFEESGYRNRLLPIPLRTLQPLPYNPSTGGSRSPYLTDHVYTQLAPQTRRSQYVLFWFIAETVPPLIEEELTAATAAGATAENPTPYQYPPSYPADLTLKERVALEGEGYEPRHHGNMGVDEDEKLYEGHLMPVEEALRRLRGGVMEEVVRVGWGAVCERFRIEGGGC